MCYIIYQGDANNLQRLLNFEAPHMDIYPVELRKLRHRDFNFRVNLRSILPFL
jgi:hypothetical protein